MCHIKKFKMEEKTHSVLFAIGQRFALTKGQQVICNGYPGTVIQVHTGQLAGMVDVRVPGGLTTVSASYPDVYPADAQANEDSKLIAWTVRYGLFAQEFNCQASDISHAVEQCRSAYPDEVIQGASAEWIKNPYVYAWDSVKYRGDNASVAPFKVVLNDQRISNGQLFVDMEPVDGQDEILSLTLEINTLPGTQAATQCVHLHFDVNELAMSIFKQGDKYILRPENGVHIESAVLGNGEAGYTLERENDLRN